MRNVRFSGLRFKCVAIALLAPLAGCTWVDLKPDGGRVRLVDARSVDRCKRVGHVTARTTDSVGLISRRDTDVDQEIEFLARNNAAELGGDAIIPISRRVDGEQTFAVYRCGQGK